MLQLIDASKSTKETDILTKRISLELPGATMENYALLDLLISKKIISAIWLHFNNHTYSEILQGD